MTKDFKAGTAASKGQYGIGWMLGGIGVGLLAGMAIFNLMGSNKSTVVDPANHTANNASTNANTTSQQTATNTLLPSQQASTDQAVHPDFSYHAILPQINMNESMKAAQITETNPEPGDNNQLNRIVGAIDKPLRRPDPATTAPANAVATPASAPAIRHNAPANNPIAAATPEPAENNAAPASGSYIFQLGSYRSQAQAVEMQNRARQGGINSRIEQANVDGQMWYRVRVGPTSDPNLAGRWRDTLSRMGVQPYMIRM